MVHFYHTISERELFEICSRQTGDIKDLLTTILDWIVSDQRDDEGAGSTN